MTDTHVHYERTHYKLGALPKVDVPGLDRLTAYLAQPFPAPPLTFGDLATLQAILWGMDGNDRLGDCTIAGVDHLIAAWNALFGESDPRPTEQVLEDQYNTLSPGDQGCVETSVLQTWQNPGLFADDDGIANVIKAFAPLDHTSETELQQGVAFTGGIYLGIQCPDSAQQQFGQQEQSGELVPWTVVHGAQVEGGHCIVAVGYTADGLLCVTWGAVVLVTWAFLKKYLEEAYAVLSQELAEKGADTLGLNVAAIEAVLQAAA